MLLYLGREVALGFELLEEGRKEEGGEEEDDGPEEHVWDVGPHGVQAGLTGGAHKHTLELRTHLQGGTGQATWFHFKSLFQSINHCNIYTSVSIVINL